MQSIKHYLQINKVLLVIILIVSIIGVFDSLYLTITHYTQTLVPCSFTQGCETVLRSSYSEFFGIPLAIFGFIFYVVTLAASIFFLQHKTYHWWLSLWGLVGFFSSMYLLFVMGVVLRSFCQYCLLSTTTSTIIFVTTTAMFVVNKRRSLSNEKI